MTKRRLTSTPALTVTAALLLGSVSSLALSSSAQAATGPDKVVVSLPTTSGKPGVAQVGSVTVTEAGQPVAGQTVTLSLDHGFFATGKEKTPSVVRAKAGNLQPTGASTAQSTTLTGTTNAQGVLAFDVAIERDPGFDDDGAVTSVVTATADAARAARVPAGARATRSTAARSTSCSRPSRTSPSRRRSPVTGPTTTW